jgi:dipeptidase
LWYSQGQNRHDRASFLPLPSLIYSMNQLQLYHLRQAKDKPLAGMKWLKSGCIMEKYVPFIKAAKSDPFQEAWLDVART